MMGLWLLPLMFAKGLGASLRRAEETVRSVGSVEPCRFFGVVMVSTTGDSPVLGDVRLRSCSLMLPESAILGGVSGTLRSSGAFTTFLTLGTMICMVSLACRSGLGRPIPAVAGSAFAVPRRVDTMMFNVCPGLSDLHRSVDFKFSSPVPNYHVAETVQRCAGLGW